MRLSLYFATFALVACAEPPPPSGNIDGHWYGQRWEGRARVIWLSHVAQEGALDIEFRTCYNGEVLRGEKQEGTSRLNDGLYETTIQKVTILDETGAELDVIEEEKNYDYRVIALTDTVMSYVYDETGDSYDVVRVDEDFTLECPPATRSVSTNPGGRKGQDAWIIRGTNDETEDDDEDTDDVPVGLKLDPRLEPNEDTNQNKDKSADKITAN